MPSLKAVAQSDALPRPVAEAGATREVFLDTIPAIRRVPTISTWPEIEDAAESIIEQGLYRGVPADEVAQQLIERTTPMFARAER